ncbi:M23 family metallopeptidase [Aliikangiella sp. IMCC44653]
MKEGLPSCPDCKMITSPGNSVPGVAGAQPANPNTPVWPTDHGDVKRGYSNAMVHPVTGKVTKHTAVDIRNPTGDSVYSVLDGEVIDVNFNKNAGNYIKVKHANGLETSYSHTKANVKIGDKVNKGATIGTSDGSGRITGPHLHFVLRRNGVRSDPMTKFLDLAKRP